MPGGNPPALTNAGGRGTPVQVGDEACWAVPIAKVLTPPVASGEGAATSCVPSNESTANNRLAPPLGAQTGSRPRSMTCASACGLLADLTNTFSIPPSTAL